MPELVRRYLRPREGWLSMALVLVMLMTLAWSLQRAGWFDKLDYLTPVAAVAVLAGALLGLTRLSVVFTLPAAAILGTGVVRNIRVELASKGMESPLDGVVVGVP